MSSLLLVVGAAVSLWLLRRIYRWSTHHSVSYIRGPAAKSRLLGNVRDFMYQENVGDLDFRYFEEYGTVWRMKAPLGSDVLMISDPKALQYIFHKSGYNFPKNTEARIGSFNVTGLSILWAPNGDVHSRHRKIMNPAFTAPQLRSFLPLFRRGSNKMCQMWKDEVLAQAPGGATIAVNKWLARTTLDVIGESAFDYPFGALDDSENEVSKAYHNMFADSVLYPSRWSTIFRALWKFLPDWLLRYVRFIPTREYTRFRHTLNVINKVSKSLIDQKAADLLAGDKTSKDVMSVLVRANASEDPRARLSEEEMVSQMATLTLAGHETTASTLTWLLYELARHPEYQQKMRDELAAKRAELHARGEPDFSMDDLEGMPYLHAALKETLRFHPIVYHLARQAGKDDVIPLAYPVMTDKGEMISEIPVAAGQVIMPNIAVYNRLPQVWGEDAHVWNPMRYIDGSPEAHIRIGMFGNLMSFSAGVRGCIGWRFSLIEMQAIAADLVENFQFSIPKEKPDIMRVPAGIMGPMVKGKMFEGMQMPLHVVAL
ncbi:cytochrome P450 [Phanerochaete sordida]|uniref:Cytochrome P450 n=1 Tax=Phanerochaete sordida TaxID=48140 RepID=A0A9P3G7G5_9APHY|nr:cytochrome P450 [Phanerochaete sordida]